MLGGAHTWGVFGAAKLFGCTRYKKSGQGYINSKAVVETYGSNLSFALYFRVQGYADGICPPVLDLKNTEVFPR